MNVKLVSVDMCFDWLGFGCRVKDEREAHGLTRYELGALCDLSAAAIEDIEDAHHGNALMSTVLGIANVLDLDIRVYFILSDTRLKPRMKRKKR